MLRQKFGKLKFVRVCKDMPGYMSHFESDFDAIVKGTYSQLCGGKNTRLYSLYVVDNEKVVNEISWYEENQLALLDDQDMSKAESMIEEYNFN